MTVLRLLTFRYFLIYIRNLLILTVALFLITAPVLAILLFLIHLHKRQVGFSFLFLAIILGQDIYQAYQKWLETALSDFLATTFKRELNTNLSLEVYCKYWNIFEDFSEKSSFILSYLDRYWIPFKRTEKYNDPVYPIEEVT